MQDTTPNAQDATHKALKNINGIVHRQGVRMSETNPPKISAKAPMVAPDAPQLLTGTGQLTTHTSPAKVGI